MHNSFEEIRAVAGASYITIAKILSDNREFFNDEEKNTLTHHLDEIRMHSLKIINLILKKENKKV